MKKTFIKKILSVILVVIILFTSNAMISIGSDHDHYSEMSASCDHDHSSEMSPDCGHDLIEGLIADREKYGHCSGTSTYLDHDLIGGLIADREKYDRRSEIGVCCDHGHDSDLAVDYEEHVSQQYEEHVSQQYEDAYIALSEKIVVEETVAELDVTPLESSTFILGDVNGNGRVDTFDSTLILRYLAELDELTDTQKLAADINGNGRVDTFDSTLILRHCAELQEIIQVESIIIEPADRVVHVGTRGTLVLESGEVTFSRRLTCKAYAYTAEGRVGAVTATGAPAKVGNIAVDPKVIPYNSKLYIVSKDGTSWTYGFAVAADCGGNIKGNTVDLYYDTKAECFAFGVKSCYVYILD